MARVAFGVVAALGIMLDQWTKHLALTHLTEGESQPFIGTILRLRLIFNPGAAFSLGEDTTIIFTGLAIAVATGLLVYVLPRVRVWYWGVVFGLLCAGVVGNLIDRFTSPPGRGWGHVVDFLELPNWPIFNVADICIVVAAVLIVGLSLFARRGWQGDLVHGKGATSGSDEVDSDELESSDRS